MICIYLFFVRTVFKKRNWRKTSIYTFIVFVLCFFLGGGNRCENTICDIWRWPEDGVQETLYCYRKQVSKKYSFLVMPKSWECKWVNWHPIVLLFLLERPKPMNYKGKDVRNVFHLRTPEDANSIAWLANNKNAVIVGTSFVGETKTHL